MIVCRAPELHIAGVYSYGSPKWSDQATADRTAQRYPRPHLPICARSRPGVPGPGCACTIPFRTHLACHLPHGR